MCVVSQDGTGGEEGGGGGGGEGTSPKSPWNSTKSLQNLGTKDIFRALWALLIVLFEIIHEWQLKETDEGKYVGMGMNPRRAILWHVTEFMSDAHISRIRTSLRRKLSHTAMQSVHSSMDSQRALLQDSADEERDVESLPFIPFPSLHSFPLPAPPSLS